ncbi:hypothetical protein DUI87_29376 [Hirundo rustica rustica]|uniref:Uncharacterized protein n=1 Tax=Hirundo rustica rustica TaxID=333673 RepID=A0A3M0J0T7_HIRRU|nr:hypothetical protein DUI87_29376 [Hirundo rustica rustica]
MDSTGFLIPLISSGAKKEFEALEAANSFQASKQAISGLGFAYAKPVALQDMAGPGFFQTFRQLASGIHKS